MKIMITMKPSDAPGTHLVLSPYVTEETDGMKKISLDDPNIDDHADDGELEELVVNDLLEYTQPSKVLELLKGWVKKIRRGGKIIISGFDAYLVAKALAEYKMTLEQFNEYLHDMSGKDHKRVSLTCQGINGFMSGLGMKIKHRRIDLYRYSVEAIRA